MISPIDRAVNISCQMSDPTVKVYVNIKSFTFTKDYFSSNGQVVTIGANSIKANHAVVDVTCHAVKEASHPVVPSPLEKGQLVNSQSKFN